MESPEDYSIRGRLVRLCWRLGGTGDIVWTPFGWVPNTSPPAYPWVTWIGFQSINRVLRYLEERGVPTCPNDSKKSHVENIYSESTVPLRSAWGGRLFPTSQLFGGVNISSLPNIIPQSVHTNTIQSSLWKPLIKNILSGKKKQHLPSPRNCSCPIFPGCVAIIHSSTQKGSKHCAFPYFATCTKIKSCKAPSKIPGWSNCKEYSHASASTKLSCAKACSPVTNSRTFVLFRFCFFFPEEMRWMNRVCWRWDYFLFPPPCMCGYDI